jgi:hypothetical protein
MVLSSDGKSLSGEWWYGKTRNHVEHVGYRYVSKDMPSWLTEEDFEHYG